MFWEGSHGKCLWENSCFHIEGLVCTCMLPFIDRSVHDKTYNKTCVTICTVWPESLLIACAFYSLWASKEAKLDPDLTGWKCRPTCLCWSHRSYCRFCHALAHPFFFFLLWKVKMVLNCLWIENVQVCCSFVKSILFRACFTYGIKRYHVDPCCPKI